MVPEEDPSWSALYSECPVNLKTTVPLTITPEATAHVAELGMQREFEQMLERALQTVPGLQSIKVVLTYNPETGDDPRVVIWSYMEDRGLEYDPTEDEWGRWKVTTFPPEVCEHFVMLTV
jgi:hypothetical protein